MAALLLTSCGDAEAETEDAPQAVEESPASEAEEAGAEDGEKDAGDGEKDAEEEPEPVPASSDGPAENWPEPEVPEEIYEETEEGVEAALEYWFEARHYMRITGETDAFTAVSAGDCEVCDLQIERVEQIYEDGWFVQEPDVVADSFVRIESEWYATGIFTLNQGAFEAYWESELVGARPARSEDGYSAVFVFEDDRWQISYVSLVGDGEEIQDEEGG